MKYPTDPVNISQVQPSANFDEPYCVIYYTGNLEERHIKRFKTLPTARRFRRKLGRIRKSNYEVRYANPTTMGA